MSSRSSPSRRATWTACSANCRAVGDVNEFGDDRGGDQCRREQPRVGAGVGPPERRHEQPEGLLPPAARQPVAIERDAQAQHQRGPVRVARPRARRRAAGWPGRRPAGPASCPAPARSGEQPPPRRPPGNARSARRRPPRPASSPASASCSAANSRMVSSSRYRKAPPAGSATTRLLSTSDPSRPATSSTSRSPDPHTASAASRSKLPANTDRRASSTRSAPVSSE